MAERRKPIESEHISTVEIPVSVFSLEKDEVFPFERMSYNILIIGIEALNKKKLPEKITVSFNKEKCRINPWSINASIKINHNDDGFPESYEVIIPEMLPTILYFYVAYVSNYFFKENNYLHHLNDHNLIEKIQYYIDGTSLGVEVYREKGLANAIRSIYSYFDHTVFDLNKFSDDYDLLSKNISYHEIAHAYTMSRIKKNNSPAESCALEIIADLVATTWIYTGMIKNTPDTLQYREFRGIESYSETIKSNSIICINTIMSYFLLFGIASAQNNKGKIKYDGAVSHPNSLLRIILQSTHMITLILSNFSNVLNKEQQDEIDKELDDKFNFIINSGFILNPYKK